MFLSHGFDDFVSKPVQGKDFAKCLSKWLPRDMRQPLVQQERIIVHLPAGLEEILAAPEMAHLSIYGLISGMVVMALSLLLFM